VLVTCAVYLFLFHFIYLHQSSFLQRAVTSFLLCWIFMQYWRRILQMVTFLCLKTEIHPVYFFGIEFQLNEFQDLQLSCRITFSTLYNACTKPWNSLQNSSHLRSEVQGRKYSKYGIIYTNMWSAEFQIPPAVNMKSSACDTVTSFNSETSCRFGGTYHPIIRV
jgi:hypothetical protein